MGRSDLLRRLFLACTSLLARLATVVNKTRIGPFKVLAVIWAFLKLRLQAIATGKEGKDGPEPPTPINEEQKNCADNDNSSVAHPVQSTKKPAQNTPYEIIPLDSSISCSLHPYPYIHNDKTRSSLSINSSIRAARSSHTQAIASHHASQSTHNLGRSQLGLEPWNVGSPGIGEDYTFDIRSPDAPSSPVTRYRNPTRGYSLSSPDLGSSAVNHQILERLERQASRTTTSPPESVQILEPDEISIGDNGDHGRLPRLFHPRIFPLPPDFFSRYEQTKYAEQRETDLVVEPMTLDFNSKPPPPGWKPILHPEGVLYWYHAKEKVVTESDLHDPAILSQVTEDLATFDEFVTSNKIQLPHDVTLALELTKDDAGTFTTDYYYADHSKKRVFFLDEFEAKSFRISAEVKGVKSLYHIQHELEAQYWHHVMLYPNTLSNIQDSANELRDLIFHYIADATSSAFSTSPYDIDELNNLLSVASAVKKTSVDYQIGAASFISRTMLVLARQKFYNWYGVPQRRLYRNNSVYGTKNKRTWLIKSLSPLLFNAPDAHLGSLHKMWVDGIMHNAVWVKSIKKLNEEWQEFILYATVLLNANVAFLAIQSIDEQEGDYRSPVQIASYLSIVASIGSIVIGLLLVRQNRTRAHGTANDVCQFLSERSHPTMGLETLAILYSLPYAMLLWGMVSFLTAFAWHCFDYTRISTRFIMGAAWVIFAALVIWCVWMGWVHHEMEADEAPEGETTPGGTAEDVDGKDDSHLGAPSRPHSRLSRRSRMSRMSRVSVIGPLKDVKSRFSWNVLAFWPLRRTSVDSEATRV